MEKNYFKKMNFGRHNLLFLIIFSIAVILLSFTYKNIVFNLAADEGLYLKYSTEVGKNGISAFNEMFKDYLSNPQNRITQNPLRVGYIILSSLWLRFFGYSISNLAYLSLFSYCIFLLLGFCFAKKYLQPELAVIFILLLAFSPINMAMARRALVDSTFNLFVFSSIWLFFENIKKKNTLMTFAFLALYSFTILIKESAAILSVFFVLYIFIRKLTTKADIRLTDILSVTIVPFMIAGFGYVILIGDLSLFFSVAKSVVTSPGVNAYAVYFCSGPWFRYLIDFIVLSPWVFILAVGFIFYYITGNEIREEINYLLLFLLSLLVLHSFLIKNIRYVMILDLPMRLFAVLMLNKLAQIIYKKRASLIVLILVLIIVTFDHLNFYHLFVKWQIYDPVSFSLLRASHIIPWR